MKEYFYYALSKPGCNDADFEDQLTNTSDSIAHVEACGPLGIVVATDRIDDYLKAEGFSIELFRIST